MNMNETLKGLTFEPSEHIYYYDGKPVISVTQVLDIFNQYARVDKDILAKAAARGTAVHEAAEKYLLYEIMTAPKEFEGYAKAFEEFCDKYNPKPIHTELRLFHPELLYAGTTDLICKIGKKTILVDYKTSSAPNIPLIRLQLEAYARAYMLGGEKIDGTMILQLKDNGHCKAFRFDGLDEASWEMFKHALAVAKFKKEVTK